MVRLKEIRISLFYFQKILFQFQHGTIKSVDEKEQEKRKEGFNSNMVRLKGNKGLSRFSTVSSFNSNMVRLKVNKRPKGKELEESFNSNMVRLKVESIL